MTENEAIAIANRYVRDHYESECQPVEVHFIVKDKEPSYWWVSYGTWVHYPEETAKGTITDDGSLVLLIIDSTGIVSEV